MKRFIIFIIILLFLGISTFCFMYYLRNDDDKLFAQYQKNTTQFKDLIQQEKYNEANTLLNDNNSKISDTKYSNYEDLFYGQIYYYQQDYQQSLNHLLKFKDFSSSYKDNEYYLSYVEDDKLLNIYLGLTYFHLEKYNESSHYLENVTSDKQNINNIDYEYAISLYKIGNTNKSIDFMKQALIKESSQDKLINLNNLLGSLYKDYLEDYEKSIYYFEKSYMLNKNIESIYGLVENYILIKDNENALRYANEGVSYIGNNELLFNKSENLYLYQGIMLYKNGQYIESLHSFLTSLKILEEKEKDENTIHIYSSNKIYLMYVYYNLHEYNLANSIIEDILSNDIYTSEMKAIAETYTTEIKRFLHIQNSLE